MISKEQFINFKKRYQEFENQHQSEFIDKFKQDYKGFYNSYQMEKNLVEEINRKEALEFNIFSILDRGHLEVLTHTPFLAELLNLKGSHGQKNLFLKAFLMRFLDSENEASDENWLTIKESEYVDLRIINYPLRKAIFIENKIYTDAHSGQLSRYYRLWGKGYFKGNGAFIYLTLHGSEPSESGFDENVCQKSSVMKHLKCLSYKKDIRTWLEEVYPQIESQKVKQTIKQYIDLLKVL